MVAETQSELDYWKKCAHEDGRNPPPPPLPASSKSKDESQDAGGEAGTTEEDEPAEGEMRVGFPG